MNWLAFAAGISITVYGALVAGARPNLTQAGFLASLPHFVLAALQGAAPVRAIVDPHYLGWSFGLLQIERGWPVTVVAGTMFLAAMMCAWLALNARRGPIMYAVATFDAAVLLILGGPLVAIALTNPTSFKIQAGEYFTIPSIAGIILTATILILPLILTMAWALRRTGASDGVPEAA